MLDIQNAEVLRAALESLQTGVCIVDRDRKIRFWNDGAERITGHLRQDVLGHFCGEILLIRFHEKKVAFCEHACPLVAAMRDGKARESRVYVHHKAGYAVPVSIQAVPIRDVNGHVIGAVESFVERHCRSTHRPPDCALATGHGLDAATQLPDRGFTDAHLVNLVKYAAEHSIPFGLLFFQLDQLDVLTATHGVDAAEAILNAVAHTLRNGLDPLDFVGRWSADRFLAVIANCANGDFLSTAERLKRLAQSSEVTWWGDPLSVTVSVGGTVLKPGESLAPLLKRAEKAIEQAVAHGGNSAVVLSAPETL